MKTVYPIIGDWYRRPGGPIFEVVATDDDEGSIEIQHFDGTVEELDIDAWNGSVFLSAEAPEDWSGSLDIDPADKVQDQDGAKSQDWVSAMDYVDHAD